FTGCTSVATNQLIQDAVYVQDESAGIQVTKLTEHISGYKEIEVMGLLDTAYGARRLKAETVTIKGSCSVTAEQLQQNQVVELEGTLVTFTGTIVKKYQNGI